MVNAMNHELGTNTYVLPSQCKQVFYSEVPRKSGWSYVFIYDPTGRRVKYNVEEEDNIEEQDDVEEQVAYVSDQEHEKVEPNVGDNVVLEDDVDEDMLKNDIDDDADIVNPFHTIFEPDDTYVELYE